MRAITISRLGLLGVMLCLAFGAVEARAQLRETGTVSGTVVDSMQGEPLPGVVVSVRGTTLGTKTDEQGRYTLTDVPPGDHILIFSKSGFDRATVADVRVLMGQTSRADGRISPEFYEMDTYEVVAELVDDQSVELLAIRQDSLQMMDTIGSDFISRVGASDAAGAVARVTGVTIAEGKYAVIRGLADRYTFTTLNGLELPSADPDKRAVQLDLYPSQAIDSVEVTKTFTPDQPGNTTGGRVNIITKSFPSKFAFSISGGVAYNTQASLNDDFVGSPTSGSTDWLGIDDGTRALNEAFDQFAFGQLPAIPANSGLTPQVETRAALNQTFTKGWAPVSEKAPLDHKFSMFMGDTVSLFGRPLGLLGSFSYDHKWYSYNDGQLVERDTSGISRDLVDSRGVETILWGALASVAYDLHEDHSLKFTFVYNQAADNEARNLTGFDEEVRGRPDLPPNSFNSDVLAWIQRNVISLQLSGNHHLREVLDMQVDWGASYSDTSEDTPDLRQMAYYAVWNRSQRRYQYGGFGSDSLGLQNVPLSYWRELNGRNMNLTFDDSIPFSQWAGLESAFKFGLYYSGSKQSFNEQVYQILSNDGYAQFGSAGIPNDLLADDQITPDANGNFGTYLADFNARTTYEGTLNVPAAYIMTDLALADPLQFVGGVRVEGTEQDVTTTVLGLPAAIRPNVTTQGKIEETDWLPAAGLIYAVTPRMNIRLNYGKTVARPTFREFSDAFFVDFAGGTTFQGNPELARSTADNFDLRWEWFPEPGDVLAASLFYKDIQDPIELVQLGLGGTVSYTNSPNADVYGFELELRKGLGFLDSTLSSFSVGANYAWIQSEVPADISRKTVPADSTRPLFDQPTYVFNADLTYDNAHLGTTATLSFNVTGRRLVRAQLQLPDIYQEPVPVLNFTVTQRLWKNWKLGFSAKNLLNPAIEETYDYQSVPPEGDTYSKFTLGMTFGMTLSYEF